MQLDPQEAQIAALKRELFLLRQENVWLRDQVCPNILYFVLLLRGAILFVCAKHVPQWLDCTLCQTRMSVGQDLLGAAHHINL